VLWNADGSPANLGSVTGGVNINVANSINNRGDVVGTAVVSDGTAHAFLWTKQTGTQDLGLLSGDGATIASCCHTINNKRQVTGFSCPGPMGSYRAFLWENNVFTDLNTLIPAGSPWYLQAGASINDAGEIVGWGMLNGAIHAYLAKPLNTESAAPH
jgi:probable HAF family extracellular repeat protein